MAIVSGRQLQSDPRTPRVTERVVVKLNVAAAAPPPGGEEAVSTMWRDLEQQFPGVRIGPYLFRRRLRVRRGRTCAGRRWRGARKPLYLRGRAR